MSKKDYQAIATVIYRRRMMMTSIQNFAARAAHYDELTSDLADTFAAENPRFDRERFMEACRTGKCKGMRPVAA